MKAWLLGGGAAVLAGVGLVVGFPKKTPAPVAVVPERVPFEIEPGSTIPPVVPPQPLPAVVDVTDIASLLDPPAPSPEPPATPGVIAVGYEEPVNPFPAVAPPPRPIDPQPIPQADDDATEVAPMPREVVRPNDLGWLDQFRPAAGSLVLDQQALSRLREEDIYPNGWCRGWRGPDVSDPPLPSGPLAALVWLTDAHLARQRDEAARPVPVARLALPPADRFVAPVRRAVAVLSAADQAPTSRLDWYTRWHGTGAIPDHLTKPGTAVVVGYEQRW